MTGSSADRLLRVTHVINGLGRGGAESALLRLVEDTSDRVEHSVVALVGTGAPRPEFARLLGDRVRMLGAERGRISPGMLFAAVGAIAATRPQVVHGWLKHSCLVAGIAVRIHPRLRRATLVWGVRDTVDEAVMSRSERLAWRLGRAFSSRCDLLVANSELGLRQLLDGGYRPRAAEVIRNGVELPDPNELARWRRETREALGLPEARPLVLAVGSIHPSKGPGVLLEAVERASRALPDAAFVRVGRDAVGVEATPEAERLMRSPLVHAVGEVASALPWMAAADVLVLSSRREGCPNAVLEAMACGCPVAATEVGDVPDLIGPCGCTVPVGDGAALGEAIVRLARLDATERARLGSLARDRIRAGHDRRRVAEAYLERYRRLLAATDVGAR